MSAHPMFAALHPIFTELVTGQAPATRECIECGQAFTPPANPGYRRDAMCSNRCVNDSMQEFFSDEESDEDADGAE